MRGTAIHRDRLVARLREIPPWKWPRYAGAAINAVRSRFFGYRANWWGPKPPGWREMIDAPLGAQLGWQWARTLEPALDAIESMPSDRTFRWRYEDMMNDPRGTMSALVEFCELDGGEALVEKVVEEADPSRLTKWREQLDPAIVEDARPHMASLMSRLGYDFD